MRFSSSALALLAAIALPASFALAQQAAQGEPPRGPSAEMVGRMQDGKLAQAKAMLRLSPEQEKLWGPVEENIRASFAERAKMRAEHQAKRAERQAQGDGAKGRVGAALPERLDKATEMMGRRAERLKAFSAAVKPLYATLSDEQKLVANQALGQFVAGGKGGHGKHAGWGGRGGRHGGGHGGRHMRGMGGEPGDMGGMGGMGGDKR